MKQIIAGVIFFSISMVGKSQVLLGYSYETVKEYLNEKYPTGKFEYRTTTDGNNQKYISYEKKNSDQYPITRTWYFTTDNKEICSAYFVACDVKTLNALIKQCEQDGGVMVSPQLYRNEKRNVIHQVVELVQDFWYSFETFPLKSE